MRLYFEIASNICKYEIDRSRSLFKKSALKFDNIAEEEVRKTIKLHLPRVSRLIQQSIHIILEIGRIPCIENLFFC